MLLLALKTLIAQEIASYTV